MLLRNKDRDRLLAIFSALDLSMEVWAYGSRVNGDAHEGSDLDLVIRPKDLEKLPIESLMSLKDAIRESNIPILVQLFDWARLPKQFHTNIKARYEVFYPSEGFKPSDG